MKVCMGIRYGTAQEGSVGRLLSPMGSGSRDDGYAQGAASIRGRIPVPEGAAVPGGMSVYLVPGEPEKADDVLRYFLSDLGSDMTFAFNNVAPGRYLAQDRHAELPLISRPVHAAWLRASKDESP